MKILIARNGEDIATITDYTDISGKGEVSHFLAELELIKLDLLEIWEQYKENERV